MGMRVVREPDEEGGPSFEPIDGIFTPLARAISIPPTWVIKDLLPSGLTIIGAPPKSLKSTFTLAISVLVAGVKTSILPEGMDSVDLGGVVLGFSAEASAGELRSMCEDGLGITLPDDNSILIADDPWLFQLDDEDGVKRLLTWARRRRPRLIFIDPFAEFHTLEEKDAREMIRILRPLHRYAKENEMAIVICHHTRKRVDAGTSSKEGESSRYTAHDLRGSSAIFGKMDGVLIFTPYEDAPGKLTIDAKFKRGKSWVRTIQFAAYGEKGEKERATEIMDDVTRMVFGVLKGGVTKHSAIGKQVGIGKKRVGHCIDALVRMGKVARVGKRGLKVMKSKVNKKGKVKREAR